MLRQVAVGELAEIWRALAGRPRVGRIASRCDLAKQSPCLPACSFGGPGRSVTTDCEESLASPHAHLQDVRGIALLAPYPKAADIRIPDHTRDWKAVDDRLRNAPHRHVPAPKSYRVATTSAIMLANMVYHLRRIFS